MKRRLAFLLLLATTAAAAYSIHKEKPAEVSVTPQRVLFFLIDTVRQDRVGAYGYSRSTSPNFDRLAGDGVLFLNCRSTSSWTKPAMASLFSGVGPIVHGIEKGGVADSLAARVPALPAGYETLVEVFKRNGFPTIGFSGNPHVSPQTGLDQGFDLLRRSSQFGPKLAEDFISWLDMPSNPDSGFFQRCSAKPEDLFPGSIVENLEIPAGVEVTERQDGVHFRAAEGVTGRTCLKVPIGHVPDQGDPFVLGLEYSLRSGTRAGVLTGKGDRFWLQNAASGSVATSFLLQSVAADAGAIALEICLVGQDAEFGVKSGFLVPKKTIEDEKPQRWFGYLHLMNPHLPYRASPDHLERFKADEYGDDPSPLSPAAQQQVGRQGIRGTDDFRVYRAHYDASIHEADAMLGAVVAELEARGLLADTLIVVTSDHGEQFLDHGGMSHGADPYGELLRVPLLFYYPRALANGKRVTGPISLLDIYPTLVDLFGFDTPGNLQGVSLLPALRPGPKMAPSERAFVTTHTPMGIRSTKRIDVMVSDGLKLIVTFRDDGTESIQLFDLTEDPGESQNLASDRPEDVKRLRAELAAERARQEKLRDELGIESTAILLEAEDFKALQALGYLGSELETITMEGD